MSNGFPRAHYSRAHAPLLALAFTLLTAALTGAPLSSAAAARAQSGRRAAPRTQTTAPPETNTTTATPETASSSKESAEPANAKGPTLHEKLVVAGRFDTKEKLRAAVIFNKFVQRLGESVPATVSLGELKRDEARARAAREEPDAYLVFLQLDDDHVQEGSLVLNSSDLVVNYQIYPPGSREAKAKGKVYYQAMGGARQRQDRFPSGKPIKITPEAAGQEAAEMVLDWFRIVEGAAGAAREN